VGEESPETLAADELDADPAVRLASEVRADSAWF
jgi:hypothetical protein